MGSIQNFRRASPPISYVSSTPGGMTSGAYKQKRDCFDFYIPQTPWVERCNSILLHGIVFVISFTSWNASKCERIFVSKAPSCKKKKRQLDLIKRFKKISKLTFKVNNLQFQTVNIGKEKNQKVNNKRGNPMSFEIDFSRSKEQLKCL